MKLAVDNTPYTIQKWLRYRSLETLTDAEKASLLRRLDIDHAYRQVIRFGRGKND